MVLTLINTHRTVDATALISSIPAVKFVIDTITNFATVMVMDWLIQVI